MPRSATTLLLLSALTFLAGLGGPAITDSDEAFYAEASREMVESGDWLTPRFNYEDRWQKPVLYYWLTAATFLAAGVTEWAARVWSALSGIGLVLVTWAAARALADRESAWLAGAIVATCLGYSTMAHAALPDLPLTFAVTLTIVAGLYARAEPTGVGWWALAGAGAALGFLLKGPVAVVLPAIVLLPVAVRERPRPLISAQGLLTAVAVFVIVGLPWYVAMLLEHGVTYAHSFFVSDNLERFATDRFNDPRPVWFYVPVLLGGMLPWSPALVAVSIAPVRAVVRRARRLTGAEWRLVFWAAMPLLFYTASIGKQPRYILPVLPPLAIMLAAGLHARAAAADRRESKQPELLGTAVATAVLFVVAAGVLMRIRPILVEVPGAAIWVGAGGLAAGAGVLLWVAARRRWSALPAALVAAGAALVLVVQFTVFGQRRPEPVERMADLVRAHRTGGEPVGVYRAFVRNLIFYTGVKQQDLFDDRLAAEFIALPERVLIVAPVPQLELLERAAGITLNRLGEVSYVNTANFRVRTILAPDPARDLERVVLASNR